MRWPNGIVRAPAEGAEPSAGLRFALRQGQPVVFRHPRDEAPPVARATLPFQRGKEIDHTNVLRARGIPRDEAILEANQTRLGSVMMITVMLVAAATGSHD